MTEKLTIIDFAENVFSLKYRKIHFPAGDKILTMAF